MSERPILVQNDPWLEPYTDAILHRQRRYQDTLSKIERDYGSLAAFANLHKSHGVRYNATTNHWQIREWAPQAKAVSLIGDGNGWDRTTHPLAPTGHGDWQLRLPASALAHGQRVKLHVVGADGSERDRVPALIERTVQDPDTHDFSGQIWQPTEAYAWKHTFDPSSITSPRIYEAHVGIAGEEPRVHTYQEFTKDVLPRIAAAGYNVIQLMAVQEHPYYGSFGYHVSSFFAATSRFGTPEELKALIDTAHGMGIAVLLDIVHSHAVKNLAEGLNDFDGSKNQYFHNGDRGDHSGWDSKCFDYGRQEVRQFLLSNVRYWLEEFRFDGFRFDGVTSMLYFHRGYTAFDHYDKYFHHDVDEDAVLYLQLATALAHQIKPGALLIAEDMSGMPGLCRPIREGGIGFTHRLGMGIPDEWIKLLKHVRDEDWNIDEIVSTLLNRRHGEATIAYAESHDQALVGDKSLAFWLMDKEMYWHMNTGDENPVIDRGIALHKIIRLLTFSLGGEGWLNFIGNEFGHPEWLDFPREGNEWSYHYCRRQWSLVDNPELRYHQLGFFDQAMLGLDRDHQLLAAPKGSILNLDTNNKVICAARNHLVFVFNLSVDRSIPHYRLPVPSAGVYQMVIDSDAEEFGGHQRLDPSIEHHTATDANGTHWLTIYTPARTAVAFHRKA